MEVDDNVVTISIHSMFPNFDPQVINDVIVAEDGNVENIINWLLQMQYEYLDESKNSPSNDELQW